MFRLPTAKLSAAVLALSAVLSPAKSQDLRSAIDIHIHADPDSMPRSIDAIALARLARERGMGGLLLKNHFEPTASLAYAVEQAVPGIRVVGGIALNRPVGGINPAAVERMALAKGGFGRVVWMPTFDAENDVRVSGADRAFVPIAREGRLLPEVLEVLKLIAKHRLALATGHASAAETLLLIREARKAGVERIVVTHPTYPPVSMNLDQMKEAASMGAYLELIYRALIVSPPAATIDDYAAIVRAAGADRCILATDLGKEGEPLHPDGLADYFARLRKAGFSDDEIDCMARRNPARLLGFD
ncbi:MAG: DUF6282 family protein [Bryobacteraceae bacterium]